MQRVIIAAGHVTSTSGFFHDYYLIALQVNYIELSSSCGDHRPDIIQTLLLHVYLFCDVMQ